MLPTHVGALALDEPPVAALNLPALPRALVLKIFALLPIDLRLRCCEVNRAWRAMFADTSFWKCLDLSAASSCARFSVLLCHAAVKKAGGRLRALDVTGRKLRLLQNHFP